MKSKLVYWLTYAGMWLLALLPFRALYILSDGVCFLMRHVVHYRRKVVRKNLKNSFPEKSFYADYISTFFISKYIFRCLFYIFTSQPCIHKIK